jgi:hypothetical protein
MDILPNKAVIGKSVTETPLIFGIRFNLGFKLSWQAYEIDLATRPTHLRYDSDKLNYAIE